ncbi:MAG: hypothetical protein ACI4MS_06355 [Candidatus Coproplasma sp.]
MKKIIRNSLITALAVATVAGASVGIATLSNTRSVFSQEVGFVGTYSLTAFAEENSSTGKTVALVDSSLDVTETKSVLSVDRNYKLYVTAIDTGDINVSSVEVGYTYNAVDYNGSTEGLSNVVYSSLSVKTSEETRITLSVDDMFASQITDFDGRAMLVVAEIPVAENAPEATLKIKANAIADFAKDFSIENQAGAWKYGYVEYQWGTNEDFTFTKANGKNDAGDGWTAEGVEIKAGEITANAMTTIAYTASEDMEVKVDLDFVGSTDDTKLALRVGIKNSEGTIYGNPAFYGMSDNTLNVNQTYSLKADDTIYFIFSNENSNATPKGALNIGIYKREAFADFANEFSIENNPNGAWTYGGVEYQWGTNEDFKFTKAESKTSDAWIADGVEIKAGWINANAFTAIAYTVTKDTDITAIINIAGGTENTRLALRIGVKNSEGTIYSNPAFYGMSSNTLSVIQTCSLNAGDTIYFIFSNEGTVDGAWPQAALSIKLYK